MLHILSVLFIFFALLAILVLTHEWGHFAMARWLGIAVEEFGFGLPPRVIGLVKVRNEKKRRYWKIIRKTISLQRLAELKEKIISPIYSLNAIPFGGFVKIIGEDGEEKNNPHSFANQTVGRRFLVLIAGITMNFLLGSLFFTLGFMLGFPEIADDATKIKDPKVQITFVAPTSPAEQAGIETGDIIRSIILPNGKTISIDKVITLQSLAETWAGQKIVVEALRGNDLYRFNLEPRANPPTDQGAIGVGLARIGITQYSFWEALKMGPTRSVQLVWIMFDYFRDLVTNFLQAKKVQVELSGPVGIVVLTNQMKEMGWPYLIQFAGAISVNLAFINFLPFPALDGGRILFLILEKLKGRPISPKIEKTAHAIGLYFLLFLMIVITFKDVSRFHDKFAILLDKLQFWR